MFNINFCKNTKDRFAKDLRRAKRQVRDEQAKKRRDETRRKDTSAAMARESLVSTVMLGVNL